MLHLEFSPDDLAQVRLAPAPDPVAETVMALGVATGLRPKGVGGGWTASAQRRVGRTERELAGLLHPLRHTTVDVFTLAGLPGTASETSIDDGADALREAEPDHVATEVRAAWGAQGPRSLRGLGDGDRRAVARLATALGRAYRRLVEPYWPAFSQAADGRRAELERSMGEQGLAATLATLGSGARWDGDTLHLPRAGLWSAQPVRARLRGRGLVLAPSMLADRPLPWFPLDTSRPAVLFCPVTTALVGESVQPSARRVDRLMGRSRARVLREVAAAVSGSSTTDVSRVAGISAATASEHLTVLREAGLVHSTRRGQRMVHTVTPLGRRLLAG